MHGPVPKPKLTILLRGSNNWKKRGACFQLYQSINDTKSFRLQVKNRLIYSMVSCKYLTLWSFYGPICFLYLCYLIEYC